MLFFVLVVVIVGFCVQFVFIWTFFGLWMWFGLVFGVCLVVVVDVVIFELSFGRFGCIYNRIFFYLGLG